MKTIRLLRHFFFPVSLLLSTTTFFWTTTFSFKAKANPILISQRKFNINEALTPVRKINVLILPDADASCTALLSDLSNYLYLSPYNTVTLQHLTNYQANNQWFGGYTRATLSRNYNGHLIGSNNRLLSSRIINLSNNTNTSFDFERSQPFDVLQPDPISYDIDPQTRRITFQGKYGPYNMTCIGNKFAIAETGDSIETFTFVKATNSPPR